MIHHMKIIKAILWAFPVALFIFLFSRYFVFSGRLEFSYDMKKDSPYVMLQPSGRVSEPRHDEQGWYRLVFDEPLYLDVRTPRAFNKTPIHPPL